MTIAIAVGAGGILIAFLILWNKLRSMKRKIRIQESKIRELQSGIEVLADILKAGRQPVAEMDSFEAAQIVLYTLKAGKRAS